MLLEGRCPLIKEEIPEAYKRLIEACWEQDTNRRPSFEQIEDILRNDISFINTSKANRLQREVSILSEVSHPSIMKFYEYSSIDFIGGCRPVIITEYLGNCSLDDIIEIQRNKIKADSIWDDTMNLISIYGVAKGMLYLHSK